MPTSPRFGFSYLEVGETVPSEAVNEALERIESGAGHFIIQDRDENDPSALTPSAGDTYIVATGGTGAWNGHDDDIAYYLGTAWLFVNVQVGFTAWIVDEAGFFAYDSGTWNLLAAPTGAYLPLSGGTLSGDLIVPADAYGAGWNGDDSVPTKNDVYDKIETLAGSIPGAYTAENARDDIAAALTDTGLVVVTPNDGGDTIDINVPAAAASDLNTGTDTSKAVTSDALAGSNFGKAIFQVWLSDLSTAITTGDGKAYLVIPAALDGMNLIAVKATLVAAQSSSGIPTVQIANVTDGVDMLSTKLTIDANETDSATAATAAVIDTSKDDVATGDILRFDIDVAGTGAKGLVVTVTFQLP